MDWVGRIAFGLALALGLKALIVLFLLGGLWLVIAVAGVIHLLLRLSERATDGDAAALRAEVEDSFSDAFRR